MTGAYNIISCMNNSCSVVAFNLVVCLLRTEKVVAAKKMIRGHPCLSSDFLSQINVRGLLLLN